MNDFIAQADRPTLERHGLASFDALWSVQLTAVDEPNVERGGWSSVFRLELDDSAFYLKRQSNHLTRTLARPFGEPTFAREFRNIRRYAQLGVPALQASFFGQRKVGDEKRAILMTRALDGWTDLDGWLKRWPELNESGRQAIIGAVGVLARTLHQAGQMHGCFYPKHIFLREQDGHWQACLIDLEKTRPLLLGWRDRIKDLEPLVRRASCIGEQGVRHLLSVYLDDPRLVEPWLLQLQRRREAKEAH
ncbi:lipopolysaccharide kinase InaA family protein [Stutzerimonas stutzeri]|uniref:lipopolysaccharide kinase InaA family protein n=2 Tax=Stutzerimonas stutzeri TaxID=316 RepID=UPI000D0BCA49|nr:lipopolysaccharide kinase InaA family protein [Stutzerimonas stutzeri]AVX14835.1 lipopolysaccharide kinase [Stutzerimonas stutzeri]AWK99239.1 lipopolysaccharide kinase [Stutzerimonas stutzeri]MDH0121360.1 lipopolysaccharide kinase InaA family protein [Stutzerimonas stutzeri]MTI90924.1 lipopolysaccharide kinase [Stutzerimonas stutzeri]